MASSFVLSRTKAEIKWKYSEDSPPLGPAYVDFNASQGIYSVRFGDDVWFLGLADLSSIPHPNDKSGNEIVIEDSFGDETGGVTMRLTISHYNKVVVELEASDTDSYWTAQYGG